MMKRYILIFILLLSAYFGSAQEKALSVGDKIPDITIEKVLYHEDSQIRLADYSSELVILNFMSVHCGTSVKDLYRYDSLQKEIDDLLILSITTEDVDKVKQVFQKKGFNLPIAVEREAYFGDLFPYRIISHMVWIKEGKVVAITDNKEVNRKNILAMQKGSIALPVKNDVIDFDYSKPLKSDNLLFQSAFAKSIPGLSAGMRKTGNGLKIINVPVLTFYQYVYSQGIKNQQFRFNNRLIIETSDSLQNIIRSDIFSYSLTFPSEVPFEQVVYTAKSDLNDFFGTHLGVRGEIEKRRISTLVLTQMTDRTNLSTEGGSFIRDYSKETGLKLQNCPFQALIDILGYTLKDSQKPFIDRTGLESNIDIELKGNLKDFNILKRELEKYGLEIKEEETEVDMLVLKSK